LITEASTAAQQQFPAWSTGLFVAAIMAVVATVVLLAYVKARHVKRRVYWLGWLIAAACAAVSLLPLGAGTTVAVFIGFTLVVVFWAYLSTPYLKIGDRIYAFSMSDSRPDPPTDGGPEDPPPTPSRDSYPGQVSARNFWWLVTVLTCVFAAGIYLEGWVWQTITCTTLLSAGAVLCGIDDATRKLPMVRGQHLQAFIVSVASILLWLAPPICYLIGYQIGKRWPMGKGKHAAPPPGI
jgi:hypothetical protein